MEDLYPQNWITLKEMAGVLGIDRIAALRLARAREFRLLCPGSGRRPARYAREDFDAELKRRADKAQMELKHWQQAQSNWHKKKATLE